MHSPTVPFAQAARHLYRPEAFQPPPAQRPAPDTPADWICYEPGEGVARLSFEQFMRTPAFGEVQRQISLRIDDCLAFAKAHFGSAELHAIQTGFDQLLAHLQEEDGQRYFDTHQLQLLYSVGKRSLDEFCLLLKCDGIDREQRKQAVRELADQASRCRGAGPAMMEALQALQQSEGTLRGAYWGTLKDLFDQSLLAYVNRRMASGSALWRETMEVHIVNRLRLELGLPGADPLDPFSRGTLVKPEQVLECSEELLQACRPVVAAQVMAAEYRARLTSLAAEQLAPDEAGRVDPAKAHHLDALIRAWERLKPVFGCTPLNSILLEDADTGRFRWRGDDALVTRDLLQALARQQLITPARIVTAVRGGDDSGWWTVCHIDQRAPFVQEHLAGGLAGAGTEAAAGAGGALVESGVMMPHARLLLSTPGLSATLRDATMDAVLRNETPQQLAACPAAWVTTPARAAQLLQRLGPALSLSWARSQRFSAPTLGVLLQAATAAGDDSLLAHLLSDRDLAAAPLQALALAGNGIVSTALTSGSAPVAQRWLALARSSADAAPGNTLWRALTTPGGTPCTATFMQDGGPWALRQLLQLVFELTTAGKLSAGQAVDHLSVPVQRLQSLGRLPVMEVFGEYLTAAARAGWVSREGLQQLLEGPGVPGLGGAGAAFDGHVNVLRWFHKLVVDLADEGLLSGEQAGAMLAARGCPQMPLAALVLLRGHAECLGAHWGAVMTGVERGWIPRDWLPREAGLAGTSAGLVLNRIVAGLDMAPLVNWLNALSSLHERGALSSAQIVTFLAPGLDPAIGAAGQAPLPVVLARTDPPRQAWMPPDADHWLDSWTYALATLSRLKVLDRSQLLQLAGAAREGQPAAMTLALQAPARLEAVSCLQRMAVMLWKKEMISGQDLSDLLLGGDGGAVPAPAFAQAGPEAVEAAMEGLVRYAAGAPIPPGMLDGFIDAVAASHLQDDEERGRFKVRHQGLLSSLNAAASARPVSETP